jgi:hypothetical protein
MVAIRVHTWSPACAGKRSEGCEARRVGYGAPVKYWETIIKNIRNAHYREHD